MKNHKDKMKQIESNDSKIMLNTFHFDFIKSCVYFSTILVTNFDLKLKSLKLCKNLLDILVKLNEAYEFELNYYNQFKLNKLSDEEVHEDDSEINLNNFEKLKYASIRTLGLSLRKLSLEDFSALLDYVETVGSNECRSAQTLIRITQFIRYISCEIEFSDEFKAKLSEFIQKVNFFISSFLILVLILI